MNTHTEQIQCFYTLVSSWMFWGFFVWLQRAKNLFNKTWVTLVHFKIWFRLHLLPCDPFYMWNQIQSHFSLSYPFDISLMSGGYNLMSHPVSSAVRETPLKNLHAYKNNCEGIMYCKKSEVQIPEQSGCLLAFGGCHQVVVFFPCTRIPVHFKF